MNNEELSNCNKIVLCAVFIKPTKVLCKRSLIIGEPYYHDEITGKKEERDNRMLVKNQWYNVVPNPNDTDETFSIIDN